MPLARYFFFVGGVLLALLFVIDATLPKLPVADRIATADSPVIRIHSDRKWPERVVFDTRVPAITPATVVALAAKPAVPAPAPVADASAKARVMDAFAQLEPAQLPLSEPKQLAPAAPKKPEAKPQPKRKVAKSRVGPPVILVAQQPRFGFFASNIW